MTTAASQHPASRFKVGRCYSSPIRQRHAIVMSISNSWAGHEMVSFCFLNEHGTLGTARLNPSEFASRYFVAEGNASSAPRALADFYASNLGDPAHES